MDKIRLNIVTSKHQKTMMLVCTESIGDLSSLQSEIQQHCRNKFGKSAAAWDSFTLVSGKPLELVDLQNNLTVCVSTQQVKLDANQYLSQRTIKQDPATVQACCEQCEIRIIGEEFSNSQVIASLNRFAQMPGVVSVLALPDLSAAVPCPVGTSVTTKGRIYPSWIGTDIGCGVSLFKLCMKTVNNVDKVLQRLSATYTDKWDVEEARRFRSKFMMDDDDLELSKHDDTFGSIGAGNHFCELQECHETGEVFLAVHSGSRSLGVELSELIAHVSEGKEEITKCLRLQQVGIAWARLNRLAIAKRVMGLAFPTNHNASSTRFDSKLDDGFELVLDICHNFIEATADDDDDETYIHRKGAIPTNLGPVLIPGSRGTNSYMVQATTGTELNSLPHGAGRRFTKADAEKKFSNLITNQIQQRHVICNNKKLLAQEAPGAYKDIDEIMQHLVDQKYITVLRVFRPLLTLKYNGI